MTYRQKLHWMDEIARTLICRAARSAPALLSDRLEEEWRADMAERVGRFSRLRFAIGCCWATRVIARESAVAIIPATNPPAVRGAAIGTLHDVPHRSRRVSTFLLVACLHVLVFYAFAVGLGTHLHAVFPTQFEVRDVLLPHPNELPPLPRVQLRRERIDVPIPEFTRAVESEPSDIVVSTPDTPQASETPPAAPPVTPLQAIRVQGGPGSGFPRTEDFYPSLSIHLGEKGVATVRVCVDARGRLTSEPQIADSTGSARLDEGALKLAKAGTGHYRASTENGQPVNSCYPFRVRFDLRN